MRLTRSLVSVSLLLATSVLPALSLRAQETNTSSERQKGTEPRSSADKYKKHATRGDVSVGAELLTRKEVSNEFAADVNRCCLVVLVAVYPNGKEPLQLSYDDFTLALEGTDIAVNPQSVKAVSAKLVKAADSGVTTAANVGVGVEFGTYTDPVTGQQVHGRAVTVSAGVGAGVGSTAPPTAAERDREMIERELGAKSLPEAKISVPVSGYLYFSLPKQKNPAKAKPKYRLEYATKDEPLVLPLN